MTDNDFDRLMKKMKNNPNDRFDLDDYLKLYDKRPTREFDAIDDYIRRNQKKSNRSGRYTTTSNTTDKVYRNEVDDFLRSTSSRNRKNKDKVVLENGDFNWDKDKEREKETQKFFDFHTKKFEAFLNKKFE